MALTNARLKAVIDAEMANITHIGFSTDGVNETNRIARKAVSELGGWTTPTAASPYEPANASAGESAECTAGANITVTHYAGFSASSGGTQHTTWIAATDPDPVVVAGGKLSIGVGALKPVRGTRT